MTVIAPVFDDPGKMWESPHFDEVELLAQEWETFNSSCLAAHVGRWNFHSILHLIKQIDNLFHEQDVALTFYENFRLVPSIAKH